MLKNALSHRQALKFTVIVDHPLGAEHSALEELAETTQVLVSGVHHTVTSLGHLPKDLVAVLKEDVVSVRFVVGVMDDETALELHAQIDAALCEHTRTRFVFGESTRARHDHPLAQVA